MWVVSEVGRRRGAVAAAARDDTGPTPVWTGSDDPSCAEASAAACNDGVDNDGNGQLDCEDDELGRWPEPSCCPLDFSVDGLSCWPRDEVHELCPGSAPDALPAACRVAARQAGCRLEE